jgi:hypothetical protein
MTRCDPGHRNAEDDEARGGPGKTARDGAFDDKWSAHHPARCPDELHDRDLIASRVDGGPDAVDGHGDGDETKQDDEDQPGHRDAEQHGLDALVRAAVVRARIDGIDREIIAHHGVDRGDVVDVLYLHVQARRKRVAVGCIRDLRQAWNSLRSPQRFGLGGVVHVGDSGIGRQPLPQRIHVAGRSVVADVDVQQ